MNDAWLLTRMHVFKNETTNIPTWAGFNACVSRVDSTVTTIGLLPILQAPADTNDTLATVIKRFSIISNQMGQRHTVIVVDQPLYSSAKELIWANPETIY